MKLVLQVLGVLSFACVNAQHTNDLHQEKGVQRNAREEVNNQLPAALQAQLPLPLLIGGGALAATYGWKVTKFGAQATARVLRNPYVAGTTGVFVLAPILRRTLFAEKPSTNIRELATDIQKEWGTDYKAARTNLEKLQTNVNESAEQLHNHVQVSYPFIYGKLKDMYENKDVQEYIKSGQEQLKEFKQWRHEQFSKLSDWLKQDQPAKAPDTNAQPEEPQEKKESQD